MKSMKSIILVVAGVLIAGAMVAFKTDSITKEACMVNYSAVDRNITIYYNEKPEKISVGTLQDNQKEFLKAINSLLSQGWNISTATETFTNNGINRTVYLERTKQ